MKVLWLAVGAALVLVAVAIAAFVWAVRSGQMDDLETPALRMLHDDERAASAPDEADGARSDGSTKVT